MRKSLNVFAILCVLSFVMVGIAQAQTTACQGFVTKVGYAQGPNGGTPQMVVNLTTPPLGLTTINLPTVATSPATANGFLATALSAAASGKQVAFKVSGAVQSGVSTALNIFMMDQ
ncbi:hypothetical protein [Fundidesulfovibrio agrisoli]|uniref:hypothetical protein n=1 Tax=Fundidesulfovibrio agrisoli TaxID=2922717 RepID=UPI001FAC69DF|nr:hypothetical protein [Fundidesulfovibrio agrisoli]